MPLHRQPLALDDAEYDGVAIAAVAPRSALMLSAAAIYAPIWSDAGTDVYHSCHSSPSTAAWLRSASCFRASGSSVACRPSSVTGSMNATLSSRSRHEGDPLEQVHVLLVLEQSAVERRNHHPLVGAAKRLGRGVPREQEL